MMEQLLKDNLIFGIQSIVTLQRMQKKKLDLNNLLAKYQGYSSSSNQNSRFIQPTRQPQIEEQFYQYKTYQANQQNNLPLKQQQFSQTSHNLKGNFVMSKSEVQQYLLSVKDELRQQERSVSQHGEVVLKQIHQNFQRNHEKLKREILELLDRAFYQNQKNIKDQLTKQSKIQPPQFTAVFRKIHSADEDINRLLNVLKGSQYRKAIAQVVTRDFNLQINELKTTVTGAKKSYLQSLGQIEPDRSRIEAIKDNVMKLFYFRKKETQPQMRSIQQPLQPQHQQSGIFSIFKDKTQVQNVQSQKQSRTRKSFFNFGE